MIAQASIFLDASGTIRAEAPGLNGARLKIDLGADFARRNPELMSALLEQRDTHRQREAARLEAVRKANIDYVAAKHPNGVDTRSGKPLVAGIWGDIEFQHALTRNARRQALPVPQSAKAVLSADKLDI